MNLEIKEILDDMEKNEWQDLSLVLENLLQKYGNKILEEINN